MSTALLVPESAQPTIFTPHDFDGYGASSSPYGPNGVSSVPVANQILPHSFHRYEVADSTPSITIDDASEPGWQTVNHSAEGYVRDGSGSQNVGPTASYTEPLFMPQDEYFGFPASENGSGRY